MQSISFVMSLLFSSVLSSPLPFEKCTDDVVPKDRLKLQNLLENPHPAFTLECMHRAETSHNIIKELISKRSQVENLIKCMEVLEYGDDCAQPGYKMFAGMYINVHNCSR